MTVGWGRWGSAFRFLLAAGSIHRVCKFQVGSLRVVLVRCVQDTIDLDDDDESEKDDQVAGALVLDRSFVSQEMQQEPKLHMQSVNECALTTYIPPQSQDESGPGGQKKRRLAKAKAKALAKADTANEGKRPCFAGRLMPMNNPAAWRWQAISQSWEKCHNCVNYLSV